MDDKPDQADVLADLLAMELHEQKGFADWPVMRVPGGWLYNYAAGVCFVPEPTREDMCIALDQVGCVTHMEKFTRPRAATQTTVTSGCEPGYADVTTAAFGKAMTAEEDKRMVVATGHRMVIADQTCTNPEVSCCGCCRYMNDCDGKYTPDSGTEGGGV